MFSTLVIRTAGAVVIAMVALGLAAAGSANAEPISPVGAATERLTTDTGLSPTLSPHPVSVGANAAPVDLTGYGDNGTSLWPPICIGAGALAVLLAVGALLWRRRT
jgi:MYXO-CTERM domain-containing protein